MDYSAVVQTAIGILARAGTMGSRWMTCFSTNTCPANRESSKAVQVPVEGLARSPLDSKNVWKFLVRCGRLGSDGHSAIDSRPAKAHCLLPNPRQE